MADRVAATRQASLWRAAPSLIGMALALLIAWVGMVSAVRLQSQTNDEAVHVFAGFVYWKCGEFAFNAEHPPLAKLIAAAPLAWSMEPGGACAHRPQADQYARANDWLYAQSAQQVLATARMTMSVSALVLMALTIAAAWRLFGQTAAWVATFLVCFEPNLIGHGPLVATDVPLALMLFSSMWAVHSYLQHPSGLRLLVAGMIAGLALSVKHSGLIVLPLAAALLLANWYFAGPARERWVRVLARMLLIVIVAVAVLWGTYGFHSPAQAEASSARSGFTRAVLTALADARLLPHAYVEGLLNVGYSVVYGRSTYLLGKRYPRGQWFYFPLVLAVKQTLAVLCLAVLAVAFRPLKGHRACELRFVLAPPLGYFALSLAAGMNLGVRHLLPILPFAIVSLAGAAAALTKRSRRWRAVIALLLAAHVISSASQFPYYIAYANEAAGGPRNLYRFFGDSDVDWGQGLIATRRFLEKEHIQDCWIAYFGSADPAAYGVPCRPLPHAGRLSDEPATVVPETIDGVVLVGAGERAGLLWEPGDLHPYAPFLERAPDEVVAGSMLVYRGRFHVPMAAAASHMSRARFFAERRGDAALAVEEARRAVAIAPKSANAHLLLARASTSAGAVDAALAAYDEAVRLASAQPSYYRELLVQAAAERAALAASRRQR